ncbi:hypothetical protein CGCF415_v006887 [Colletotrichum fructicola]|nr:hypothetical protein CGCTS75_v004173 [Colletotrichum tropicale]KAF4895962.1 hypothetical protein CGCFRS4_v005815 [Colletotrichum fructicola]KAF4908064.1 hypothetical protein CGCF415_v006887 [Colletotrichum fructicola]KAF4939704.1 hypothetical protein CGCF245_v003478 [Colletotrichum fructicola]
MSRWWNPLHNASASRREKKRGRKNRAIIGLRCWSMAFLAMVRSCRRRS